MIDVPTGRGPCPRCRGRRVWRVSVPTGALQDGDEVTDELPKWADWCTIPENLWDGIFARVKRGIPVTRIVLSFKQWERFGTMMLGCPHVAKVTYGVVKMLTAAGEIEVVPGDVPDNEPRYE